MRAILATPAALVTACLALAAPLPAHAQARDTLEVGARRTLTYARTIDRVEVDRENVIAVSAPTPSSLRLSGLAQGEAVLRVYAADGSMMEDTRIRVLPGGAARGGGPVPGRKVVAVDVHFAAVSASTLKALGFNFSKLSGDLQGAIVSPSSLNSARFGSGGLTLDTAAPIQSAFNLFLSAPNRGIGAALSVLQNNGLSQLLAQPTLLVRSGEEATFLAGGEIPIPVPQNTAGNGSTIAIEYKEFGVRLSVTPHVLSPDQIVLKLSPEVSEPDYTIGVQFQGYTVPGLRRRTAETTVELGSGQSFVIAGLNYSASSVSRDKVPLLGDIPILGAFFKRQQNQKERQELIIVATPRLVEPLEPGNMPPLPQASGADPSFGDIILGTDGLDKATASFGVVRR
jgi:pilus assembly protein CpaC